jgi:hypothetical protein
VVSRVPPRHRRQSGTPADLDFPGDSPAMPFR